MSQTSILPSKSTFIWWRYFLNLTVIGIIYVITGVISGQILSTRPQLPIIWLPSGIMLAIVMIGGYRYIVGLAVGVFFFGLLREQSIVVSGAIALSNMTTIAIGTYLLKSICQIDIRLKRIRDVILLVMLGGFGVMLLGSIGATLITTATANYSSAEVSQQFLAFWMGSSLSVVFITPLIFAWCSDFTPLQSWRTRLESSSLVILSILLGWIANSNILQFQTTTPIFYLMLPPIIWAMARFRLREVTLVNAIMIGFLLWGSQTPNTLISDMPISDRMWFIWSTVAIGSVVSLLIKVLIDERHTIEQTLKTERDFTTQILETLGQGVTVVSKTGHYEYVNPAFARLLDMDANDLIGRTPYEFVADSFKPELDNIFKMRQAGESSTFRATLKNLKDEEIVVLVTGVPRYIDSEHVGSISVVTDIRPLLESEQARKQSEAFFHTVFQNSAESIVVIEKSGKIAMTNLAHQKLVGYSAEELLQMTVCSYLNEQDAIHSTTLFQEALQNHDDSYQIELRVVRSDKTIRWIDASVGLIWDKDGNYQYTVAVSRDITESRNHKLAIENSEKRFRAIFENASLPIAVTRGDCVIRLVNRAWCDMLGYSAEELQGMKFDNITYSEDIEENIINYQQLISGEIDHFALTKRYVHRDGSIVWANLSVSRFVSNIIDEDEENLYTIAIAENITERKLAEIALKESEEQYRTIFENSLIGIYRSTLGGRFLRVNPAMVKMFGYNTADELYNLDIIQDLYVDPTERHSPTRLPDGLRLPVNERTVRLKKKNGDIIIVDVKANMILDDDGNILYTEGSMVDVTEQHRQAEEIKQLNQDLEQRVQERTEQLETANKQLLELDRLRAKFIADMSHEMRTPLAVLNTRLYLLQHSKDQDNLKRHIDGFQIQLDRLHEFVENAFDLSVIDMSRNNITFEEVSLNDIVHNVIKNLAPRTEINELELNYQPDWNLPHILGVESHLSQVATNLVGNAIKYTEVGQIQVTTGIDSITNRVYLRVEDSGMGIAEEDIPHLFSRFYRGQRAGQSTIAGTGLGLSIVKEIVDAHGGYIDVESQINDGSVFTIWLPIEPERQAGTQRTQDDATTRDE